jgi:hypothetical protein
MKAKEKGIPESELHKGDSKPTAKGKQESRGGKFNAFREMDKQRKGEKPQFAKIPETVAVVGTPVAVKSDNGRKRDREEDGEGRPAKEARPDVSLSFLIKHYTSSISLGCIRWSRERTKCSMESASEYRTRRRVPQCHLAPEDHG